MVALRVTAVPFVLTEKLTVLPLTLVITQGWLTIGAHAQPACVVTANEPLVAVDAKFADEALSA